ncbi:putative ethanolamine kinase [Sphaerosporella brunnea]|uniref:ethanolamine kinase n=1 Tax=Sphaerosporella brunnea TaxID=1250544 RepID=A0A5J5F5P0_9PEZI|nr:putative ethanolamine kinase [Sphaerosporella brunnea]
MDTPATLQLSYNWDDPSISARQLLYAVFPEWKNSANNVEIKQLTEGTTNKLFKIVNKAPSVADGDETVLLRVYGAGTDVLVDREREFSTHCLLAQHGLAPPVLARFENGLFYRFVPGRPCEPEDLGKEAIWRGVARRLGEWHAILPTTVSGGEKGKHPSIWTVLQKWISILPEDKAPKGILQIELDRLMEKLGVADSWGAEGMVLGHCDLLSANVIVHQRTITQPTADDIETVSFIDYEYSLPCPAAFDLANHFSEWPGFACNYALLPSRSVRRNFLREYVHSYNTHRRHPHPKEEEEEMVIKLGKEVDTLRGVPGFFWGVCALVQATAPAIVMDMDAAKYAHMRLAEYWEWRAGAESEREKRWAAEV